MFCFPCFAIFCFFSIPLCFLLLKKKKQAKRKFLQRFVLYSLFCDFLFILNPPLLSSFKKEKVSKKKILAKMILSPRRLIAEIYLFLRVAEDVDPYGFYKNFIVLRLALCFKRTVSGHFFESRRGRRPRRPERNKGRPQSNGEAMNNIF